MAEKSKLNLSPAAQAIRDLIEQEKAIGGRGEDFPDEEEVGPENLSDSEAEAIRQIMQSAPGGFGAPMGGPDLMAPTNPPVEKVPVKVPPKESPKKPDNVQFKVLLPKDEKERQKSFKKFPTWEKQFKKEKK